jgi:peptidoglycan/xylan/chitin deacetylase (PgdA/CDA1 family)
LVGNQRKPAISWHAWRASIVLAVGVLSLGSVSFMAMLPAEGVEEEAAPRETLTVADPIDVDKDEPPTPPSPEPVAPAPSDGLDCAAVACVALTFDDGPSAHSAALLDRLHELGVRATFFNTGQNTRNNPATVKRQVDDGHQIGGHSWNHANMKKQGPDKACADAHRTAEAIQEAAGVDSPLVRPPYGDWNDAILKACQGKTFILWDVDTLDWSSHDAVKITDHAIKDSKPGSIILMHDTVAETIDALPAVVAGLRAKGYELVTVAELFGSSLVPGEAVYSGPRTGVPATPAP